jgi:hypothetical protein
MNSEGSLPWSQKSSACSYPKPDESSPLPYILFIYNQFQYYSPTYV